MTVAGDLISCINKTGFPVTEFFVIIYSSYLNMPFGNVSSVLFNFEEKQRSVDEAESFATLLTFALELKALFLYISFTFIHSFRKKSTLRSSIL